MNKQLHLIIAFAACLFIGEGTFASTQVYHSFGRLNLSVSSLITNSPFSSEKSDESWLYVSEQIAVSNIYPNPASDHAAFNYIVYDAQTSAKVVIRNVLGSVVGEYVFSANERQLVLPLERFIPGVYFYTLWVNNKSVVTKKLIVKR